MKHRIATISCSLVAIIGLAACASQPTGPTVAVMPAPNKSFDVFELDQIACRQFADQQVGGAAESANNRALGTAVLGTALGAGLGAAVGGGRGAAIGAASGAVVGTGIGANSAGWAQMSIQQRYDLAYSQCMYSKGNQVPGFSPPGAAPPPGPPPGPPPAPYPPPPGYYPAPPPP